jgi:hypothetical protein
LTLALFANASARWRVPPACKHPSARATKRAEIPQKALNRAITELRDDDEPISPDTVLSHLRTQAKAEKVHRVATAKFSAVRVMRIAARARRQLSGSLSAAWAVSTFALPQALQQRLHRNGDIVLVHQTDRT